MEKLICRSLLWKTGLITCEDYNETLNEMFLKNIESDILLELEGCTLDYDFTYDILKRYRKYEYKDFSVDNFGKCLLDNLKIIYQSNIFPIKVFGRRCYSLWRHLPEKLQSTEPFDILTYADDPLSWDDEEQSRRIYEELFEFYK